ncbi:hypothetical protein DMP17_22105 [Pseudonocardia sp. TMWB2A]|uniref:hypothetical protein n=1 Tax=Pseudonocardia sp. TMWB2A TaxID=687430 RepID=UPI00307CC84C
MNLEDRNRVHKLREAASRLDPGYDAPTEAYDVEVTPPARDGSGALLMPVRLVLPAVLRRPVATLLHRAADRIEFAGWSLGQHVSGALDIAGAIVGEDLSHHRVGEPLGQPLVDEIHRYRRPTK